MMHNYKWFPWSDVLLFVLLVFCLVLVGCTDDGNRGGLIGPTPPSAHAYEMACYNEPALPGGDLFVIGRTVEADLCSVESGAASGGFVVQCFDGMFQGGRDSPSAAYLCISFEQVR